MQQDKYENKKEQLRKALGTTIESLRSSKNKTPNSMSDEIGISKTTWLKMERGQGNSQLITFCRVAEALEISPAELLNLVYKNLPNDFTFLD